MSTKPANPWGAFSKTAPAADIAPIDDQLAQIRNLTQNVHQDQPAVDHAGAPEGQPEPSRQLRVAQDPAEPSQPAHQADQSDRADHGAVPTPAKAPRGRSRAERGRKITASSAAASAASADHAGLLEQLLGLVDDTVTVRHPRVDGETFTATVIGNEDAITAALPDIASAFGVPDVDAWISTSGIRIDIAVTENPRTRKHAVWIPAALREALRGHTNRTGESVTGVVLGAFNRCHTDFGTWFADRPEPVDGPMTINQTRNRESVESPVQLWLNLRPIHTARLDAAVRSSGARSRSELVTVLLEHHLGTTD